MHESIVHFLTKLELAIVPLLLSSLLTIILGQAFLKFSSFFRSAAREYTPQTHIAKNQTPTMGGFFILAAAIISTLIFSYISGNRFSTELIFVLLLVLTYAVLGAIDDLCKISKKRGISERAKFISQFLFTFSIVLFWYLMINPDTSYNLIIWGETLNIKLGLWVIPWTIFIIIGTSNAVNITDGLDGLAAGSLIPNFLLFGLIFAFGSVKSQLAVVSGSFAGACLGFLKFNSYPAKIFMGDVGSLPLGALLGFLAVISRVELLLILSGFIFVVETFSVILQVLYFKKYRARLFKMAPFHHHLELTGFNEKQITKIFSLVSWALSIFSAILYMLVNF